MASSTSHADLLVGHHALHGEGPVWDAARAILYWVDMISCHIHAWNEAKKMMVSYQFDEPVCALSPLPDGRLLVAFAKRMAYVSLPGLEIEEICQVEPSVPGNRCNDGKMDPAGRFWIGTMSNDGSVAGAGTLYRLDEGETLTPVLSDLTISNGMDWSADGRTMYFTDSAAREVWAFDFNPADSSITNRRTAISVPLELGIPDGMALDREGMLWVAHWGSGCICRWNPANGKLLHRVKTGCPHTSSCCFGGENRDHLFITTSRLALEQAILDQHPSSGGLFHFHHTNRPAISYFN